MGAFSRLDARRLRQDVGCIVGDERTYCTIYRREPGQSAEVQVGQFWARIANIGRQTTGLEKTLVAGHVTNALWVLRVPPGATVLQHDDEVRTNSGEDQRWRVIHTRRHPNGQVCILSKIE